MPAENNLFWRLMRFGLVGATVMVFFSGLNWLFGLRLGKALSFLLAYPPALALHFYLNKRWTFGHRQAASARQVSEYIVMVLVTFAIQASVFKLLTTMTGIPGWAGAAAANAAQMAVTFVAMQFRIFRSVPDL